MYLVVVICPTFCSELGQRSMHMQPTRQESVAQMLQHTSYSRVYSEYRVHFVLPSAGSIAVNKYGEYWEYEQY